MDLHKSKFGYLPYFRYLLENYGQYGTMQKIFKLKEEFSCELLLIVLQLKQ